MKLNKALLLIGCTVVMSACGSEEEKSEGNPYSTASKEVSDGGKLFKQYCVQCHGLNEDRIGPKLKGSFAHWNYDTARISAFIRNSKETIESGDPRAMEVAEKWNHALMTPMPHLSDENIRDILEYIAE